ncbi:acyl-CoA synthetase (AMP-forming)/AMP-acid ligase II [Streptosporangium becharense]|uniref:Acyl-CoA synthetase (AMP-forming)/AMP-acid ligase II n=1 Tax=Streptosporangium becharense TaxID=1816182 RepID=A0A7W9IFM1_9ACTN|nr:acyl-CoA synthetase [Streptosporangium becharense]MBB2909796.1 acyl-CoA synthetase (AMP-forming)/AMP-acid ligase II [Streptosporangium becharense]MBB5819248.1 acyl-CoA synthetase (AMP-forming)/AMP-acid ligase II [Streptosporangium becharense]
MEFNHADLFEGLADAIGERTAVVCGDRRLTYAELDAHANRLAHHLESRGVRAGQHVGVHLYNGVEYVAALLAALKIRAVPVNVNYRYVEAELLYLYRDSDIVALLFDVEFDDRVAAVAPRAPALRHLIAVGGPSRVEGAVPYEEALAGQPETRGFPRRSGDDLYIIYTGGTTGMPKGVMWRTEDLFFAFGGGNPYGEPRSTPREVIEAAAASGEMTMLAAAPLMHGAAQMATFITWCLGGTMAYVRTFDAAEVLRTIDRERVLTVNITGDAMARPLADEIATGAYDLSSLVVLSSTGAILTGSVRDRLLELLPGRMIVDSFGSTESGYTASAVPGSSPETGLRYRANPHAGLAVLNELLEPVEPGSGELGTVAKAGRIPFGYYKDEAKTARTFVTGKDGVRWLLTGDIAKVEEDGTITVFGRGSVCINTGGEKVFPEEVEAVLKGHPAVFDAVVTGIPDERWGSRVAAVVELRPGATPSAGELDAYCRRSISGYKVPRTFAFVEEMVRSPAGKADYRWARQVAEAAARA